MIFPTASAHTSSLAGLDFGPFLDVAARSSAGAGAGATQNPENQDNLVLIDGTGRALFLRGQAPQVAQVRDWPAGHVRLAVLDGMGGHGHGREAAEATATGILGMPACHTQQQLDSQLDALHGKLQSLFAQAFGDSPVRRPGTTLTLLELRPGLPPLLFHAGDSRLYEITAHDVQPLTIDHVPATAFAMHGLLTADDWWQQVHGEHRSLISQAFILGNAFRDPQHLQDTLLPLTPANLPPFLRHMADRRTLEVRSDAVYLLASDGFWACAEPDSWIGRWPQLLGPRGTEGNAPAAQLIERLFDGFIQSPPAGLHIDNLTAIILCFKPEIKPVNIDETALPESVQAPVS